MKKAAEILRRIQGTPNRASQLVQERGEVCDRLHMLLDRQKTIEVQVAGDVASERGTDTKPIFPNEALRRAEESRRLAASAEYQQVLQDVDQARKRLREVDAELESVQRRHASDLAVIGLVTALMNAGKLEDAEVALAAYAGEDAVETAAKGAAETAAGEDDTVTATVLEVRHGKNAGIIRAWCELADGRNAAIYGKNGIGQALASAVGKKVRVRVRAGNAGLIALRVDPAA